MEMTEDLAIGIIVMAAKDYRLALRQLKRNPHNRAALEMVRDCEQFFQSEYYETLTNVDGGYLIRKLREEVEGV